MAQQRMQPQVGAQAKPQDQQVQQQQWQQSRQTQVSGLKSIAPDRLSETDLSMEALEAMGPEAVVDMALTHLTASARQLEEMVEDNRVSLAAMEENRVRIEKLSAENKRAISQLLEIFKGA